MRHATRPNQEHNRSFSKHCQDSCTSSIRQRGGTVGWSLLYLTGCPSSLRRRRVHHIPVADHSNQTLRFLNEQILATVCLMSAGACRSSIAFDSKCETDRIRPMSCICKVLKTSRGLPEAMSEFWIYVNLKGVSPLIVGSAHNEFSRYEVGPQCCRVLLVLSTHPSAQLAECSLNCCSVCMFKNCM